MNTYFGIDWMHNNPELPTTVYILKVKVDGSVDSEVVEVKKESYDEQVKEIVNLIEQHDPISIVTDAGYGAFQNQMLQTKYKDRVKTCYYASNSKGRMSYNTDTWMFTIDKDDMMIEAMKFRGGPFRLISLSLKALHALNYAYIAYISSLGEKAQVNKAA
jgi:hypothetical protein